MKVDDENNDVTTAIPRSSSLLGELRRRYHQQRRPRSTTMAYSSADENPHPAKRNRLRRESPVAAAMPTPPRTLMPPALLGVAPSPLLMAPPCVPAPLPVPRLPVHGSVAILGRRREMEDNVAVVPRFGLTPTSETYSYYAIYDGHGGKLVAEECRERLHLAVLREAQRLTALGEREGPAMWARAMATGFARFDEEIIAELKDMGKGTVGSTAVVALLAEAGWLLVANCGDSRAVLSRGGRAMPLSCDHKPDRPDEYRRVQALGGQIINWDCPRVLGMLATSRAIGDYFLKPFVSCEPELSVRTRSDEDEFLILASDGLWDAVSNELACDVVRHCLREPPRGDVDVDAQGKGSLPAARKLTPKDAAAVLARLAIGRGSGDNVSVVVVDLRKRAENNI